MRSWGQLIACVIACMATSGSAQTQDNGGGQAVPSTPASPSAESNATAKSWVVRDPWSGRLYQQHMVSVSVPVTRWEAKTVEQTVYEPVSIPQVQNIPNTVFVPQTQYVMQPRVKGWWNPLQQPTQAYEFIPVTRWIPQTQYQQRVIPSQQWTSRQQKVVIYQPVQSVETRQQLVQKELPQPNMNNTPQLASLAGPRQPLVRLPILAKQSPWGGPTNYSTNLANNQLANSNTWVPTTMSSPTASARPINPMVAQGNTGTGAWATSVQPRPAAAYPSVAGRMVLPPPIANLTGGYRAPLQPTTTYSASRDLQQSGMQATVLR